MKMRKSNYSLVATLAIVATFWSCGEDGVTDDSKAGAADYTNLLTEYTEKTVIGTYADMKDNAMSLHNTVVAFASSASQSDLDAACESWKLTRAPWEKSEAFLFGPAAHNGLDPLLDSWPLDQSQLENVLAGQQELNADNVRNAFGAVIRGFHTIEYLLFRDGENRNAADLTTRETEYLVAVTQVLRDDCITLWALWEGVEDGSAEAEILAELEIEIEEPYKDEFLNAGQLGSSYFAQRDAVDEIIQGILDIADEVANGKVAGPYTSGDVYEVESWHSWNSLTDFKNNIRSIENAYTSSYNGVSGEASLSSMVVSKDTDLDTEVKETIQAAIDALNAINEPFRNNLNDDVNIPAAMDAINAITTIFDEKVKSVVFN